MMKIFKSITIAGLFALLTFSCELDQYPTDEVATDEAFETMQDALRQRNGLYVLTRDYTYDITLETSEWQSDLYNATSSSGMIGVSLHRMDDNMLGESAVTNIWWYCYYALDMINDFLSKIDRVEQKTDADAATIADYKAEAHYLRALAYYTLIKHYGADYVQGGDALGVPLLKTFNVNDKPARATVAEVYDFIKEEITLAESISRPGAPNSQNITKDAVKALKAKILLLTGDKTGAAQAAKELINSGNYPLVGTKADLKAAWHDDTDCSEDIFTLHVSATEGTGDNDYFAIISNENKNWYNPTWLPTQTVVDMYEPGDLRNGVYLSDPTTDTLYYNATKYPDVLFMKKYPRTDMYTVGSFRHKPRIARIAEMYLIAAEATKDVSILNELRTKRGATALAAWSDAELQNEWVREMIGDGVRIECLKRWNIGFNGRLPQNDAIVADGEGAFHTDFVGKVCPAGYYRLILPMPENDLRTNPNLVQTPEWLSAE